MAGVPLVGGRLENAASAIAVPMGGWTFRDICSSLLLKGLCHRDCLMHPSTLNISSRCSSNCSCNSLTSFSMGAAAVLFFCSSSSWVRCSASISLRERVPSRSVSATRTSWAGDLMPIATKLRLSRLKISSISSWLSTRSPLSSRFVLRPDRLENTRVKAAMMRFRNEDGTSESHSSRSSQTTSYAAMITARNMLSMTREIRMM
mmetsp:Transcript_6288/g.14468  ORF Transcript_6288/g.14468 Transcript_6288/m.14468 type:complete len:204 (-) Transcript_6288:2092-2703(-)